MSPFEVITIPAEKQDVATLCARSIKYTNKWMVRAGFSGYGVEVKLLPKEHYGKCWAASTWSIDDEWVVFYFMPDSIMPKETLELTVIHEVAHGLVEMGKNGTTTTEQACWRIAHLVRPGATTPQRWVEPLIDFDERLKEMDDE